MKLPIFEVFADPNWRTLFVNATGIQTTLVSPTEFVVTDAQGGQLTLTGTGFQVSTIPFTSYEVLTAGTITGFNITVDNGKTEIAYGDGYDVLSSTVANAIVSYFEGAKTALIDLWFGIPVEVVGTAAHLAANLPTLIHYATHVSEIKATGGVLVVSAAEAAKYQVILVKVAGGFDISDSPEAIAKAFATLDSDASHIKSITFTGSGEKTLTLSAKIASADASLVAKIAGAFVLEVRNADGSWTTTGHGDHLTIHGYKGDTITGDGTGDVFVFATGFGHDVVTDFGSHLKGSTHDTLDWSAFTSLTEALKHSKEHNGDLVITDVKGDTVTLDGVTKAMLSAAQSSDFKWG